MSSLDESRLLKLSRSEILIWILKSLRKERNRGGYEGYKCVALEGGSELSCQDFLNLTNRKNQERPPLVRQMCH